MNPHLLPAALALRVVLCAASLCTAAALPGCATRTPVAPAEASETEVPDSQKSRSSEAPRVFTNDQDSVGAIGGDEIRVLVWNVHKGSDDEWIGDFRTMAADSDLVLLQEAHLHPEFRNGLVGLPRWDMVQAWQFGKAPTGVLTGSDASPIYVHALDRREPMLRTNKSALVTEYRLAGSDQTLLVANVHAINFTVDTRAFRAQLIEVADLLDEHEGPAILSGDLNTWREERRAIVQEIADALGLTEVAFDGPRRQFGRFPLDHVYYRDLQLLSADVPAVGSSDHNPLRVSFRNPGRADNTPLQTAAAQEGMAP